MLKPLIDKIYKYINRKIKLLKYIKNYDFYTVWEIKYIYNGELVSRTISVPTRLNYKDPEELFSRNTRFRDALIRITVEYRIGKELPGGINLISTKFIYVDKLYEKFETAGGFHDCVLL